MNNVLLEELLLFSNIILDIQLNNTKIEKLIYLDDEQLQPEFLDSQSFILQECLMNSNDKNVYLILNNLSKAIETNCNNEIDLNNINTSINFSYSFIVNSNVKAISKRYSNIKTEPNDIELFKKYWLKEFINKLKKIELNIRQILSLPTQQAKTIKVLEKEYDEIASKYENKFGHEIPFGAIIFDDLKKEVEKFETETLKLFEYKKLRHYWVNALLTNSNIIGDTEIAKRIIPLIDNEIYLLELTIANQHQQTKTEQETDNLSNPTLPIKFNNQNFTQFIKDLEYNYPIYHTPLSNYHQWQTNLKYLKQEILSNLIVLTGDSKKPYLQKLLYELQEHFKYVYTVKSDVDELYDLYDTNEYKLLHERSYKNELHIVLNNEPENYEFPTEETFKINPFHIQERFYNYHYGVTISDAVDFIKFQEIEYGFRDKVEIKPVNIKGINKINNTNIKQKSFKYTNNDSTRLPDLMNALIKDNFIDKETEIKQFRKIFSGNEIEKQIIWIGNISELSYFIKSIHNIHKKIDNTKQKIWEITYQCFIQSDGTSFDKSKFRGQKAPVKKTIIDKIVKIL